MNIRLSWGKGRLCSFFAFRREINIEKLLIIGAGGHGRCCLDIARETYDHIAFLDDNLNNKMINDSKVIGSVDDMKLFYPEYKDIFIAVGNNKLRKQLIDKAEMIGYDLVSLLSKNSIISNYASIGKGTVVFPNAVIEANATVGNDCVITANTTVNHDAIIEDHVLVYSNTVIRPNTLVGSYSRIGSNCTVIFGTKIKANINIDDGMTVGNDDEYCFEMGV